MVSEHVGRPLAGSCAERRYSNSVGSTAVGELLAAANDVGQKRFVAVPAAASSRAKRSHRPPVRDEVISRRPHWRPRPMRQSCPSDPGFLGGGAVTSAYKTLLRSSSAHRAGTLMMLGPYLRARIVVATCRLVQPFPTYGDRSSFQPSPDEMTLNRSQHSSRIECWSGGPGVAGSSPVSPTDAQCLISRQAVVLFGMSDTERRKTTEPQELAVRRFATLPVWVDARKS